MLDPLPWIPLKLVVFSAHIPIPFQTSLDFLTTKCARPRSVLGLPSNREFAAPGVSYSSSDHSLLWVRKQTPMILPIYTDPVNYMFLEHNLSIDVSRYWVIGAHELGMRDTLASGETCWVLRNQSKGGSWTVTDIPCSCFDELASPLEVSEQICKHYQRVHQS
jgi:hypothetical protein